jgi:hypothetical protein
VASSVKASMESFIRNSNSGGPGGKFSGPWKRLTGT